MTSPGGDGPSVAIVGAGAAGLAAAWTLRAAGLSVDVIERLERPGGRLRTERFEGGLVEVGAQFLASHQTESLRILREVGADDLIAPATGRDALWRRGRGHAIQYGSLPSMIASGALPARLKLRLASRYVPFLHKHAAALDPNDVRVAAAAGLDGESIAAWGRDHLGEDFVELLARPQTAAYYGAEPEETSAALYHSLASAALDLRLLAAPAGMGGVAERWAQALQAAGGRMLLETPVARVEDRGASIVVETALGERAYAGAIVATPAPHAAQILAGTAAGDRLRRLSSRPSALLAVSLDRPYRPGWFGLGLPRSAPGGDALAVVAAAGGRHGDAAPEQHRLALIFPAPGALGDPMGASPRAAFERLWGAAAPLLDRGAGPEAKRARLYRQDVGHALFRPGFRGDLRALSESGVSERIRLAGDYLVSPTIEGAVRSGVEAASALLASIA